MRTIHPPARSLGVNPEQRAFDRLGASRAHPPSGRGRRVPASGSGRASHQHQHLVQVAPARCRRRVGGIAGSFVTAAFLAVSTKPALIERSRRLRAWRLTGQEIAEPLGYVASTVGRVLTRAGHGRLKVPGSATGGPRYERAPPGELVHFDTTGLDCFTAIWHRIHGNCSRAERWRGLGKDYFHVASDDATRMG